MTRLGLGVMAMAIAVAPQTLQPGQMTQARVHVDNHGRAEAIPVDLRESNLDVPLRVRVVNATEANGPSDAVHTRASQQVWEYETVNVSGAADVAAILNRQGTAGWETTGLAFTSGGTTTLVLKRPR